MPTAEAALSEHGPEIEAWLRKSLRDDAEAAEAWSAACERIIGGFDRYRGDTDRSLRAWLFAIARNEMYRLLGKRAQRRERALRTGEASALPQSGPGISTQLREADRLEQLERGVASLLEELEPEETALLVLRFQEGHSHRDIADALSTPDDPVKETTIRKRLSRLTAKLRERASEAGLEELSTP